MAPGQAPRDGFVAANSLRFHYLDWGEASKPPMLLLHGGGQTAHSWDEFAAVACQRYRVIAPDQRGHGDSDWASDKDYSARAMVQDVAAIADALGLPPFVLMGLSMGGRNAIVFAASFPKRVTRLVIVDVGPEIMPQGAQNIRRFTSQTDQLDSFEAFVERARTFNPRRSLENLRERLRHNLKQLPSGTWTWKYDPYFRDASRPVGARGDLWPFVRKIRCPTLVVRGAESDILSAEGAEKMRQTLPGCRLAVVERAGHSVMGDNPSGFLAAVWPFLGHRLPPPRAGR